MKCLFILSVLAFTVYGIVSVIEEYQDNYGVDCKLTKDHINLIKMLALIIGGIFGVALLSMIIINIFTMP